MSGDIEGLLEDIWSERARERIYFNLTAERSPYPTDMSDFDGRSLPGPRGSNAKAVARRRKANKAARKARR